MRCDAGKLFLVEAVVLVQNVLEVMLPMHRYNRLAILVKEQEARISINGRLNQRSISVLQNPLNALLHIILHGENSCANIGFGGSDVLRAVPSELKLMVNPNGLVLHI